MEENPTRNIKVEGTPFFENCIRLQLEQGLTLEDVVNRSGLSAKTLERIMNKKVKRVQKHTIIKMARCFGVSYYELMGEVGGNSRVHVPGSTKSARPLRTLAWIIASSVPIALLAVGWILINLRSSSVECHVEGSKISGKSSRNGEVIWSHEHTSAISSMAESPWPSHGGLLGGLSPNHPDNLLAYGLRAEGGDAGQLNVVDRRTGKLIWRDQPDLSEIAGFFGEDLAGSGSFFVHSISFADLDGDQREEMIAVFIHHPYYPSYIRVYDSGGKILSTYFNDGHLDPLHAEDLDGDGKEEILVGGTNNRHANSAVVLLLDDLHCRGGSVDGSYHPNPAFSDSALYRLHLPSFDAELMLLLRWNRPHVNAIQVFHTVNSEARIQIGIGAYENTTPVKVLLDGNLRPIHAYPTDFFRTIVSEWIRDGKTDFDYSSAEYWDRWLMGSTRYSAGSVISDSPGGS